MTMTEDQQFTRIEKGIVHLSMRFFHLQPPPPLLASTLPLLMSVPPSSLPSLWQNHRHFWQHGHASDIVAATSDVTADTSNVRTVAHPTWHVLPLRWPCREALNSMKISWLWEKISIFALYFFSLGSFATITCRKVLNFSTCNDYGRKRCPVESESLKWGFVTKKTELKKNVTMIRALFILIWCNYGRFLYPCFCRMWIPSFR